MWMSLVFVILALTALVGEAFLLPTAKFSVRTHHEMRLQIDGGNEEIETGRRDFIGTAFGIGVSTATSGLVLVSGQPALAAAANQPEIDKANVIKGYQRLQFLLDNWDKETTVCGMGGDKLEVSCDRTPVKVMDYLGFKSTKDPLYKAEKTLRRLYEDAPANRDAEFIDAVEVFSENAEEASSMAFISSWGEANPGGGKDRVELFIERAKKNVINSRNSLKTVIDILELDASKK
mmetsp:Transcript_8159/g.17594  ORF Transcript_8159/g.17594 Transcript_8159/m.17594 type:complete len:234 (-) Transcript_8159:2399-3100(-)